MDQISFNDWSERLDHFNNSSNNDSVWLPAYGFPNHSDDANTDDSLFLATAVISDGAEDSGNISNCSGSSAFLVLETIFEEESDDLEEDSSEPETTDDSDTENDDVTSVIHISPDDSGSESERDVEVPKKRRRRELLPSALRARLVSDEDESSLSRSSSLIQFESLEQEIAEEEISSEGKVEVTPIPVFRTSATHKPFLTESEPPSFSSFSFDSLEQQKRSLHIDEEEEEEDDDESKSIIKDSLEENSTSNSDTEETSSSSSSSDSDSETYFLDRNKLTNNLRQNRLRSYRSFDSLLHAVRPIKFSNSLENNTILSEENDIVPDLKPININTLRSSENLSEDSGFGEIKLSPPSNNITLQNEFTPILEENKVIFNDNLEICSNLYEFSDNFTSINKNVLLVEDAKIQAKEVKEEEEEEEKLKIDSNVHMLDDGIVGWGLPHIQHESNISSVGSERREVIENATVSIHSLPSIQEHISELSSSNSSASDSENSSINDTNNENTPIDLINNISGIDNTKIEPDLIQNLNSNWVQDIINSSELLKSNDNNSSIINTKNVDLIPEQFEFNSNNIECCNSKLLSQSQKANITEVKAEIHQQKEEDCSSKPKIVETIIKKSPEKYTTIKIVSIKVENLNSNSNSNKTDTNNRNINNDLRTNITELINNSKKDLIDSNKTDILIGENKSNELEKSINLNESIQELSINIIEPNSKSTTIYNSAPSLLLANKGLTMAARNLNPPTEITEEIIQKKVQVGGIPLTPESSPKNKSTKFGNFFQRFSFRKNKKQKGISKSEENLDNSLENDAFDSVQKVAEELSNLDQSLSPNSPKKSPKIQKPPLPTVGPSKSRLFGVVGKKKENDNIAAQTQTVSPANIEANNTTTSNATAGTQLMDKNDEHSGEIWNQKIDNNTSRNGTENKQKASSLVNLGMMLNVVEIDLNHDYEADKTSTTLNTNQGQEPRAKSMEFLLDEENKASIQPPENELRKVSERQLSEHELRVQRSLQRLNVPDWYKNSTQHHTPTSGSFLLKRSGSGTKPGGWQGLSSKTTSLSSLQQSPCLRTKTQQHREGSTASPSPIISPSPQERLSFSYAPFSRWSTSRLHSGPTSANTSPSGSTRSSFHYRQPYLGWRSQEKLLSSTPTHYRTPAERLAANMVTKPPLPPAVNIQPPPTTQQAEMNEQVRSSIKEVTSAIVHYVTEKNLSPANTARPADIADRSPSPRGSKSRVWVESSFVGSRPLDSPQTPHIGDSDSTNGYPAEKLQSGHAFMDIRHTNGATTIHQNAEEVRIESITETSINFNIDDTDFTNSSRENLDNASDSETNDEIDSVLKHKPKLQDELTQLLENFGNSRPTSATIEDVLDSLLGLPPASRSPSPVISPGASMNYLNSGSGNRDGGSRKNSTTLMDSQQQQEDSANIPTEDETPFNYATNTTTTTTNVPDTTRRHSSGALTKQQKRDEKTRRVSFELEPTTLREVSLYSAPSESMVKCRYAKCNHEATITEARRTFKTCHNCNTHIYCSRECRRAHWEKGHRKTCLHGRIGALCRRVVSACKDHSPSLEALSKLARRGYLANGRGCVKVFFSSPELAERFTNAVLSSTVTESLLPGDPYFVRWADLLPTEMGNEQYKELLRLCKSYNPDTRLILYVAVCVISEIPSTGAVKWERQLITRCSKLRLHRNHVVTATIVQDNINITRDMDNPETLILTPLNFSSTNKTRQKEIAVTNIQRQLRQRGVSLRKQFPEVYRKLCAYVDTNDSFTPVTIHPKDSVTGRNFMCIIMPEPNPGKLENVPTDSSRVQTIDIGVEQDAF